MVTTFVVPGFALTVRPFCSVIPGQTSAVSCAPREWCCSSPGEEVPPKYSARVTDEELVFEAQIHTSSITPASAETV